MSDLDLGSLRANAVHLSDHGSEGQANAATDILPVIDTEIARRAALPKPAKPARRAPARKVPKASGHQTALPKAI